MMGLSSIGFTYNILIILRFALQWREWKVRVDFDQFSNERRKDRKRGRKFFSSLLPPRRANSSIRSIKISMAIRLSHFQFFGYSWYLWNTKLFEKGIVPLFGFQDLVVKIYKIFMNLIHIHRVLWFYNANIA